MRFIIPALSKKISFVFFIAASIVVLYYTSTVNYLLFHGIVELWSIIVACCFFMIAWNVKDRTDNPSLVYLGIAYFFVAALDLTHTLSYKGMRVFEYDYYASDLWIAARYMESISLLVFFSFPFIKKRISFETVFGIYFCVTCLLLASIYYWKIFPVCYVAGVGQTHFKIYSEYIICAILILSALPLGYNSRFFDKTILRLLYWTVFFTIASELSFSLYKSVYGFPNFMGHIFKLISFYMIYKALIENGLRQPFNLIFKELKEKEALLNMTQKIARIGGWDYDLASGRVTWTDEVYRIRETPVGSDSDLERVLEFYTDDSKSKIKEAFQKLVAEGGSADLELEMITATDKKIWVRVTFLANMEDGKTTRISGIIQDITERKNVESLRADIERITRHDLKTPLNSIFMASQLLQSKKTSLDDKEKMMRIIQDSVYRLTEMINLSLNLYRIEEGAYKIAPSKFDLNVLLRRVINDQHILIESKKLDVIVTENGRLPDKDTVFDMKGDEILIYSMLSNLCKNAVEASPPNEKIEIVITRKDDTKYTIEIRNKGAVPLELRKKFFNKYATSGKKGGTGIGAYSAKLIAELHKGSMSMISSDESGTSIIIELPIS